MWDLQAEFGGDVKSYIAFKMAESQGRIKGRSGETKSPVSVSGAAVGDEVALRQEFAESADLQAEYGGDVDAYVAFEKAEAAGRAKVCSGHGVAFSSAPAPKTEEKVLGKGIPISKDVREVFAEVSARVSEEMIRRDEQRQYAAGISCSP